MKFADKLVKMSDTVFDKLREGISKKNQLGADIAKEFFAGEFKTLQDEFVEKLPGELAKVIAKMGDLGEAAFIAFGTGAADVADEVYNIFKDEIETIIRKLKKDVLDSNSPSRVTARLLGLPAGQGIGVGFKTGMAESAQDMGIPIPQRLMDALKQLQGKDDEK